MNRPIEIMCEVCGDPVAVSPKGRVPRYHPQCREAWKAAQSAGGDEETAGEGDIAEESAKIVSEVAESPEESAEIVEEQPKLRQVAPVVWVDEAGNRYTSNADDGWPYP